MATSLVRAAALTAGVFGTALAVAQDARQAYGTRQILSELTAPGVDRGVHDLDAPRPPRSAQRDLVDMADLVDPGDRAQPFRRDSIIVKFRSGTSAAARRSMLALVDGAALPAPPDAPFDLVALDGADPEAVSARLQAQPDVEYAQPRYRLRPTFVPNDPLYARQWNYPAIDMERAWDINPGASASITVAVLDTGVAYRSALVRYAAPAWRVGNTVFPSLGLVDVPMAAAPDLGPGDRFVAPRDFIWNDTSPFDLDGHGTHVAGTIGQATNNSLGGAGMAFNVRIMPVKVLDTIWDFVFGSPFIATDDVVARGVRYAVDNGARVLNLSLGRTGNPAPVIRDALQYAVSRGAFVVVAAGNEFLEGNPVERPADVGPDIDGVVTIGAVGRGRGRAFYSNTGDFVELVAPGGDQRRDGATGGILQQTYDFDFTDTYLFGPARYRVPRFDVFAYQFFQGTSMAAPHVAGFAALLMQQGITNPAALEAVMKQTATDLGPAGRDGEYGHGLINPRAALRGLGLVR